MATITVPDGTIIETRDDGVTKITFPSGGSITTETLAPRDFARDYHPRWVDEVMEALDPECHLIFLEKLALVDHDPSLPHPWDEPTRDDEEVEPDSDDDWELDQLRHEWWLVYGDLLDDDSGDCL
jgi:hypothetical protein